MAPCSMSLLCYSLLSCQLSLIHDAPWRRCPHMEPRDGLPFPYPVMQTTCIAQVMEVGR